MEIKVSLIVLCSLVCEGYCSQDIHFHDKGRYAGDACETKSGAPGVCKKVPNCPWAKDQLKNGHRNFTVCSYDDFEQIVCCPLIGDTCHSAGMEGRCCLKKDCPVNSENKRRLDKCDKNFPDIICCPMASKFRNYNRRAVTACEKINLKVSEATRHVINGDFADEAEFPHMAVLGYDSDEGIVWRCGASLISETFLLSAAHCVQRRTPRVVRLGVNRLDDSSYKDVFIRNSMAHPNYDLGTKFNDVALIELRESIVVTKKINPACLYVKDDIPPRMILSGWGNTGPGDKDTRSNDLMKAILKPLIQEECVTIYANRFRDITGTQFCANAVANNSDSCRGDSGGPMQIREFGQTGKFFIVGVVSLGPLNCGADVPGIYTKVSNFVDWIEDHVWPLN